MTSECLIVPTESPYSSLEIKRALLTFEKVKLISPDDRDLFPSSIMSTALGFPPFFPAFINGSVRPLGKKLGYNEAYEKIFDEFKPAEKQGLLEVVSTHSGPPASKGFNKITLGYPPRFDYPLNEKFVYDLYRFFASDETLIKDIIVKERRNLLEHIELTDDLALQGQADMRLNDGPDLPLLNLPDLNEHENGSLTVIARSRIASLIKCAGYCQDKDIMPIFRDHEYGNLINNLIGKSKSNFSSVENDGAFIRRSKVLQLFHREFIDDTLLDQLSLGDVIKLRTTAWGKQSKHKYELFESVSRIAMEASNDNAFEKNVINRIEDYRKKSAALTLERKFLKHELKCHLAKTIYPCSTALTLGNFDEIGFGMSVGLTLLTASPMILNLLQDAGKRQIVIAQMEKDMERSAYFGLHNFYSKVQD